MTAPPYFPEQLSVIVPAYNASATIVATLEDVIDWLQSRRIDFEVVVVDDGSTDDTVARIQRSFPEVRLLVNERNRGKGYSVRRGMLAAQKAWTLFMDADNSTRIHELEKFAAFAREGAAVIIASRRLPASRIVRQQHRFRQALGRTFPIFARLLALPDIHDTQCGFKLFRRDAAQAIFSRQRVDRFAFDVEVLLLAKRLGYTIQEVPISWDNPTTSTLRISRDAPRMLWDLLCSTVRLRFRSRLPQTGKRALEVEQEG
ncbi:MAG: dolichyl-phosphate beta-glucosyltransferase [Phycisphaerae bacterium]